MARDNNIRKGFDQQGNPTWDDFDHEAAWKRFKERNGITDEKTARVDDVAPPKIYTALELQSKVFEPVKWAIPDILPQGAALLAGSPKIGKSFLALNLASSIAEGGIALGDILTEQGRVLYLALEDNERRMKERFGKLQSDDIPWPDTLSIAHDWPRLHEGGIPAIEQWLMANPDARLVIIDTLAKFRPPKGKTESVYESDIAIGHGLARLAEQYGVAILLIHHTRKLEADDPLDTISGSLGLSGGMDSVLVLKRSRGTAEAELFVTGRDIKEEKTHGLTFDTPTCSWIRTLTGAETFHTQERHEVFNIINQLGPIGTLDIAREIHGPEIAYKGKEYERVRFQVRRLMNDREITKEGNRYVIKTLTLPTTH